MPDPIILPYFWVFERYSGSPRHLIPTPLPVLDGPSAISPLSLRNFPLDPCSRLSLYFLSYTTRHLLRRLSLFLNSPFMTISSSGNYPFTCPSIFLFQGFFRPVKSVVLFTISPLPQSLFSFVFSYLNTRKVVKYFFSSPLVPYYSLVPQQELRAPPHSCGAPQRLTTGLSL